ncbi:ABC transporter substrate-binding protein [Paenibacillus sambharensis]|nr:extracellular solute-binding protein [Paenibacillus sambharensis]
MFWDEEQFFREYGNLFNTLYPDIEIEVADTDSLSRGAGIDPNTALDEYIEREQPDVLVLDKVQYKHLALDNRLLDLEHILQVEEFHAEDLLPSALRLLRNMGGGTLKGLSPIFSGSAIYYNKDLFDKHQISPPSGKLTWRELLELALRFPADGQGADRTFGFEWGSSDPFDLGLVIGIRQGLDFADHSREKLVMNSPRWREILSITTEAFKSGAIHTPEHLEKQELADSNLARNPFVTGKIAMALAGPELGYSLGQAKQLISGYTSFNWGMIAEPIDPQNPDYGSITLRGIYAVREDSQNRDAAVKLVEFINSDQMAKASSRTDSWNLQTRTKYNKNSDGVSYEPFYALDIQEQPFYISMPPTFSGPFMKLASSELRKVVNGEQDIEEAIREIQLKGQEELDKAHLVERMAEDSPDDGQDT